MPEPPKPTVRIGCWAAFWGDTGSAATQILRGADVDYLVGDHLAEITMALLARARAKDPEAGYVRDAVTVLAPLLAEIHERGIKVVTNAGALNPRACAQAFREAAGEAGLPLRVVAVQGDDLMPQVESIRASAPRDMFTGAPFPPTPLTMNAYLGARPVAAALADGADIVVTGRCVDSAVVLGPLLHEFGWSDSDHDLLSAGTLIGHIVECGPQCTGGLFTDWADVAGWDDMGYPVAECDADGTAVITKPAGTGGLVTTGTVGEQILYEITDPGAYVMPDVICDWRQVTLEQAGPDRVRVSGAVGRQPSTTYKVTVTQADGYRALATAMFAGLQAGGRARCAAEAIVARSERLIAEAGHAALTESSIEIIGAGRTPGSSGAGDEATEAVVKIGVRHPDKAALEVFATEFAPLALVAQGMTGFFAGRPRVSPAISVFHFLIEKSLVPVNLSGGEDVQTITVAPGDPSAVTHTEVLADQEGGEQPADTGTLPLRRLAYARSGDKGNRANIGVMAREARFLPTLREQLTVARVAAFFEQYLDGPVRRWELPGLNALNFELDAVLGGAGGTSTLRYDAQGKSYAAMLLTMPIEVPASWVGEGTLAVGAATS
jgi:hypothetical protein